MRCLAEDRFCRGGDERSGSEAMNGLDLGEDDPRVDEEHADAGPGEAEDAISPKDCRSAERDPPVEAEEWGAADEGSKGDGFRHVSRGCMLIADPEIEGSCAISPGKLGTTGARHWLGFGHTRTMVAGLVSFAATW